MDDTVALFSRTEGRAVIIGQIEVGNAEVKGPAILVQPDTTVLVDPAGNVVGAHAGEGVYEVMQPAIESLVLEFDDAIDSMIRSLYTNQFSAGNYM